MTTKARRSRCGFRWGWFSFALIVGASCFYWGYRTGKPTVNVTSATNIAGASVYYLDLQNEPGVTWKELGRWTGFPFHSMWPKGTNKGYLGGVSLFVEPDVDSEDWNFPGGVNDSGRADVSDYRHRIMWIALEEQDCVWTITRTAVRTCERPRP